MAISLGVSAGKDTSTDDTSSQYNTASDGEGGNVEAMDTTGQQQDNTVIVEDSATIFDSDSTFIPEQEVEDTTQQDYFAGSLVDIAAGNDSFSTLMSAVQAAGLVETLSSDGPLTVFAPTNEAFADLPAGTLARLLLPENIEQLTDILTYHVVGVDAPSKSLSTGSVNALNGDSLTVVVSDSGGIMVNNANVVTPDIRASNGIIHVIDKVLLPEDEQAVDEVVEVSPSSPSSDLAPDEEPSVEVSPSSPTSDVVDEEVPAVEISPPSPSSPTSNEEDGWDDDGDDWGLWDDTTHENQDSTWDGWNDLIDEGDCFSDMLCCFLFLGC